MNKYDYMKSILKNGDICEFKTCDNKIFFGFYMDGYFYGDQENKVIVQRGGCEHNIVTIRRPQCLRNAFDCFKYGDLYNYDYRKYGAFDTIYEEPDKKNNSEKKVYCSSDVCVLKVDGHCSVRNKNCLCSN